MRPHRKGPPVFDREKARVQFHQCALLSSKLRRNHNYTLLPGLAPLKFMWRALLCLFWLCHTRIPPDRKWMRIMDAYLMEHLAADLTVFTPTLDMSEFPFFINLLKMLCLKTLPYVLEIICWLAFCRKDVCRQQSKIIICISEPL